MRASGESCTRLLGLTLALVSAIACSSAISTVDIESARTAAQVMTALVNDPEVGARPIEVRVTRGVVRLSGRVRTPAEMERAIALAGAVPGVTRVDSSLRVGADSPSNTEKPPSARPVASRDPAVEFSELESPPSRLAIGASLGGSRPTADALAPAWSIGPLLRLGSGVGLGPALGFDWYRAVLTAGDRSLPASRLQVRPIMAGLSYGVVAGRVSVVPSLVAGYAFNRVSVPDAGAAGRLAVDAGNSLAWRPGLSMWIDTGRRTAVNISIGRLMTRLNVTYLDNGLIGKQSLDGDSTIVTVGLAYRLY
jgi:hypothetical protein